jgi:hypothetical protein
LVASIESRNGPAGADRAADDSAGDSASGRTGRRSILRVSRERQ